METSIVTRATAPASVDLFAQFLSYIDRCEKTARTYAANLRQFAAWTRYSETPQPRRQDIIRYRDWLSAEHDAIQLDPTAQQGWSYRTDRAGVRLRISCKPYTVKQYLQSVKQFFSWTASAGLYENVAVGVHGPRISATHRKDSLTAGEVLTVEKKILSSSEARTAAARASPRDPDGRTRRSTEQGKRLLAIYLLAVTAGLRTVEISRANVRDLESRDGDAWLYIWGKGHAEPDRKMPLAPPVYAAILDYLRSREDPPTGAAPLFVSTGNRSRGQRIAPTTISTWLKTAMRAAGYNSDRLTAHSLRHTTGQAVMEITGANIYATQQFMRHRSPATTELYLDNETTAQDAVIARQLYDHYHGAQDATTTTDRLSAALLRMTPQQREQLANIADAIAST